MSMIPKGSRAYSQWVRAYGPEGDGGPIPPSDLLVGGHRAGQRIRTPKGERHLIVPVPSRPSYFVAPVDVLPSAESCRRDHYEKRTLVPAFSAAPIQPWVLIGLSDDNALALWQEWK